MRVIDTFRTVLSLAYSPCGRFLYAAGWQHVSRWDLNSGEEAHFDQDGCGGYCQGLTVSPAGARIAWLAQLETRWELRSGDVRGLCQTGLHQFAYDLHVGDVPRHGHLTDGRLVIHSEPLTVSPDGSGVAFREGKMIVVGQLKRTPLAHPEPIPVRQATIDVFEFSTPATSFGFASSQSVWVAAPGRLQMRDTQTGRLMCSVNAEVTPRAVTPNGRTGIAARKREVLLLDLPSGAVRERYNWDVGTVEAVAVAPDGLTAAVAGWSGGIAIFDLDS